MLLRWLLETELRTSERTNSQCSYPLNYLTSPKQNFLNRRSQSHTGAHGWIWRHKRGIYTGHIVVQNRTHDECELSLATGFHALSRDSRHLGGDMWQGASNSTRAARTLHTKQVRTEHSGMSCIRGSAHPQHRREVAPCWITVFPAVSQHSQLSQKQNDLITGSGGLQCFPTIVRQHLISTLLVYLWTVLY